MRLFSCDTQESILKSCVQRIHINIIWTENCLGLSKGGGQCGISISGDSVNHHSIQCFLKISVSIEFGDVEKMLVEH